MIALLLLLQDACADCHDEAQSEFAGSIHHSKGLDCRSCHGTDEIVPERTDRPHSRKPTFTGKPKDIVPFCAQCHAAVSDHFAGGPHAAKMTCLACHQHHRTDPADFSKLSKWCYSCHEDQPDKLEVASMTQGMRDRAATAHKNLLQRRPLRRVPGIDLGPDESRSEELAALAAYFREAQHGVDMKALHAAVERSKRLEAETSESLKEKETALARRPLCLAGFLALWVTTGILAALKIKRWSA